MAQALKFIEAFESGELDRDEIDRGFQDLIDSGVIHHLQGPPLLEANRLLDAGRIHL